MTPTQRTLKALKERETTIRCAIVEKWNPYAVRSNADGRHAGVRQDLFGIVDILALDLKYGFVGVQCTGNDFSGHLKKLTQEKAVECLDWLKAGGRLELWAWRKVKVKRGGKAETWSPRIENLTVETFLPPWHSGLLTVKGKR